MPSMSVSSAASSRASTTASAASREPPIASISSMKRIAGAERRASSNARASLISASPGAAACSSPAARQTRPTPRDALSERAMSVLPEPGGPCSSSPVGGGTRSCAHSCGKSRGSAAQERTAATISSIPATPAIGFATGRSSCDNARVPAPAAARPPQASAAWGCAGAEICVGAARGVPTAAARKDGACAGEPDFSEARCTRSFVCAPEEKTRVCACSADESTTGAEGSPPSPCRWEDAATSN
eukprot:972114-Pleurochrysis_carterae.AAC.10